MIRAIGIDHVVLRVADLERSIIFYRDVLGLEIDRRRDELGLIHMRAGHSFVDLVSVDGRLGQRGGRAAGRDRRNMDHLCLVVANFDKAAIIAELKTLQVTIGDAGVRYGANGSGMSIYLEDPDGNELELRG